MDKFKQNYDSNSAKIGFYVIACTPELLELLENKLIEALSEFLIEDEDTFKIRKLYEFIKK
jgi:predicted house-cleaning noncanonical NTP pyrophosphatase (MazG superfamily)